MNTTIIGTVRRINGNPIPNAIVRLLLPETAYYGQDAYVQESVVEAITNAQGNFTLGTFANSLMATRSPYTLEIFEGAEKLESREIYIPQQEVVTLEEITAYSKALLFVRPQDKMQGVVLTEDDTTATFEFLGAGTTQEDVSIKIGDKTYILPTWLINGGQG